MPTTLTTFRPATRVNTAITANLERHALHWIAQHLPNWFTSDGLTALGLAAQIAAGIGYALARHHRSALLLVCLCLILNWFGDSLDGTLARIRNQQRPRYGFYVDHIVDIVGALALMAGLAVSGFLHWQTAIAMLIAFLLLAAESYLATHTLARFELSQGGFGPTEIRLLLIAGNLALLHSPHATVLGRHMLLFDLGGIIASAGMASMFLWLTVRHTVELYRAEPLA